MEMNRKTTKTASFPNTDAPQVFREIAENGTKQAKETYEKMSTAATQAADLITNSYSTAFKGAQEYNNKLIESLMRTLTLRSTFFRRCPA
jgi:hypothetical protein